MDSPKPGLMSHIKRDSIIRSIMEHLVEFDLLSEDVQFNKEQLEKQFLKLLEHLEIVPMDGSLVA